MYASSPLEPKTLFHSCTCLDHLVTGHHNGRDHPFRTQGHQLLSEATKWMLPISVALVEAGLLACAPGICSVDSPTSNARRGFLVYISDRSTRVSKFLGSSPVPVLATLILLSYAKVLRTFIAMLSLTTLYYPYNTQIVWVHDANIPFTKYIPLALVAVLFLIFLFLPYTLLLLLGQWLQPKSHLRFLSWIRSPKVTAILDSYHAPYKLKHRYWTGLLLLLRCALFLVFAFNVTGDDSINLLGLL